MGHLSLSWQLSVFGKAHRGTDQSAERPWVPSKFTPEFGSQQGLHQTICGNSPGNKSSKHSQGENSRFSKTCHGNRQIFKHQWLPQERVGSALSHTEAAGVPLASLDLRGSCLSDPGTPSFQSILGSTNVAYGELGTLSASLEEGQKWQFPRKIELFF